MKNKKFKWAIPLAVLALGGSTFALTACNKNKNKGGGGEQPPAHVHEYTEWVNTDPDEHWKICPEDGAIDESTREEHEFDGAGECECGAEEAAVYGTVKGEVKLFKKGAYVTDFTDLEVEIDDDYVDIDTNVADGKFTYSISNVKVGKEYTLKITKDGYKTQQATVELDTEGQEETIDKTLEYEVFKLLCGWDSTEHDFSHVNDAEDPYVAFREHDGNKTLNILTADSYKGNISASMKVKFANSTNGLHTQGMILKFEDGKHLVVRYHNGDVANGNIQYCNAAWDDFPQANTLFGEAAQNATDQESSGDWRYGEHKIHELTASEGAKIKADGADLTLVIKDGALYTFFDGKYVDKYTLPVGYAEKSVQVGYFIWNTASNAKFNYDITDQVPAEMKTALDINVTKPAEATDCNVTATPAKEKYEFGDQITLNITAHEGYILRSLTVGGEDMFDAAASGSITVTADRPNLEVNAEFVKEEPIALNITVRGKKLGKTEALPQGTEVKFSGIVTPFVVGADGKITGENVVKTKYTVEVEGYKSQQVDFDENTNELVFEYDTFKSVLDPGWGAVDFSKQNDATTVIGTYGDCSLVFSNDTYGKVKTSIDLKGEKMTAGTAGLVFRFVGEGLDAKGEAVAIQMKNTQKIHTWADPLWEQYKVATGCGWTNMYYFEDCNDDGADRKAGANAAKYLEEYKNGTLKLSVMRDGKMFYVFLDDTLIGQMSVDDKYKDAKCEVGFYSSGINDKGTMKNWKFYIDESPVLAKAELTDETAKEGAHGSLTLPTGDLTVGDSVEITVNADTGYKLAKLEVGGVDVTANVSGGKYTFTIGGDTVVKATFEEITVGTINAAITGKKLGVDGNSLKAGDKVTLTSATLPTVKIEISEVSGSLMIQAIDVPAGEYTLTVNGYIATTLTVVKNAEYNTAIALQYDLMENLTTAWGWGDKASLDNQNNGELTQSVSATQWVSSKDSFDSVAITATVVGGGNRQGVFIRFKGDSYANDKYAMVQKENDDKVTWNSEGNIWGNGSNLFDGVWTDYVNPLTDADKTAITNGTYELTLVRDENRIHVFINGEYYDTKEIDSAYSNQKCYVGIYCTDTPANAKRTFRIEDASKYLVAATITDETTDTNGTVDVLKSVKLGDKVTVTVTPASGYCVDTLTVGTTPVCVNIDAATGVGTYQFFVSDTAMTVNATFTDVASSLESAVTLNKLGATVTEGTVKLTNAKYSFSADIVGGKIAIGAIPAGEYTVSMNGSLAETITVAADTKYETAIVLEYDTFYAYKNWGTWDFSKQNEGKISMTNGLEMAFTKETYDDVAFSVLLGQKQSGKYGNQGIAFRFGDDIATIKMENQDKVQVLGGTYADWYVSPNNIAAGSSWHDLIFFTGENADANAQTYLDHYNAGTLKLTCVRKGATVYVFLDGTYVGKHDFDAKYANVKANVGFSVQGLDDSVKKEWTVSLETDISEYEAKIAAAETPAPAPAPEA